jgi:hypothetical protein
MGGLPCEAKIIRDYGILGAEAAGLSELAVMCGFAKLSGEARTLSTWALEGGWKAALKAFAYGESLGDGGDAIKRTVVVQSYTVCDWAKRVRLWRDAIYGVKNDDDAALATICKTIREWIDADMKVLGDIAEAGIPDEYKPKPAP